MMGPFLIFAALINRATIALYEDAPLGSDFGQFIEEAEVNMLGVVPTIVKSWRSSGCMENCDWSRIHVFSSTGESSHATTCSIFRPSRECAGNRILWSDGNRRRFYLFDGSPAQYSKARFRPPRLAWTF
jgi:acyl-coenzyme A synthetase/AMP-(fatty) acid ligase